MFSSCGLTSISDKISELRTVPLCGPCRYWCNVRIYAGQVLLALEDLHKKELMYRDLKPENLLVCVDGSVKLSDLGLATHFPKNDERVTRVCGTPEYMSPEMLTQSNGSGYNYMTDIWSYGIFIYELLTSSTPFCPIVRRPSTETITCDQLTLLLAQIPKFVEALRCRLLPMKRSAIRKISNKVFH